MTLQNIETTASVSVCEDSIGMAKQWCHWLHPLKENLLIICAFLWWNKGVIVNCNRHIWLLVQLTLRFSRFIDPAKGRLSKAICDSKQFSECLYTLVNLLICAEARNVIKWWWRSWPLVPTFKSKARRVWGQTSSFCMLTKCSQFYTLGPW